ncbi:O-acetyltransferase OatA [Rhizobiaceae bacterium]|nr:O-acetyltransferase OatA [Rhizobiaceae bacterium]
MQDVQKLSALTGLRFVAALMIVLHHLHGVLWIPAGAFANFALDSGVSFFFVLSGFILHYNYRNRIARLPWHHFIWMRFWRLWPAHIAALLFALALSPTWWLNWLPKNLSAGEFLQIVFLLQSWTPESRVYFAWNGPAWSISTEMAFYAAFPILCFFAARRPAGLLIAVGLVVLAHLTIADAYFYDPDVKGIVRGLSEINPIPRLLEFAAGVVICETVVYRQLIKRMPRPTIAEILALLIAALALWAAPTYLPSVTHAIGLPPISSAYARLAIFCPAFCLLIAVFSFQGGAVSRFLSTAAMVWLGETSFALYLVHQPVIFFIRRHWTEMEVWQQIPLFAALTLGTSAGVFYFIERPGIRFSRVALGATKQKTSPNTLSSRQD